MIPDIFPYKYLHQLYIALVFSVFEANVHKGLTRWFYHLRNCAIYHAKRIENAIVTKNSSAFVYYLVRELGPPPPSAPYSLKEQDFGRSVFPRDLNPRGTLIPREYGPLKILFLQEIP